MDFRFVRASLGFLFSHCAVVHPLLVVLVVLLLVSRHHTLVAQCLGACLVLGERLSFGRRAIHQQRQKEAAAAALF